MTIEDEFVLKYQINGDIYRAIFKEKNGDWHMEIDKKEDSYWIPEESSELDSKPVVGGRDVSLEPVE